MGISLMVFQWKIIQCFSSLAVNNCVLLTGLYFWKLIQCSPLSIPPILPLSKQPKMSLWNPCSFHLFFWEKVVLLWYLWCTCPHCWLLLEKKNKKTDEPFMHLALLFEEFNWSCFLQCWTYSELVVDMWTLCSLMKQCAFIHLCKLM